MKKLFIVSAIALFFGINAQAFEAKPYVAGKINFNIEKYDLGSGIDFDDKVFGGGFAVGIAGGKALPIRVEFEYNLLSKAEDSFFNIIDASSKLNSYMLNFYYDFHNGSNFIPYINFGLGATTAKLTLNINDEEEGENYSESGKETKFTWQVGAGSYYKINESLFADLGVKYSQADDLDLELISVSLGLRYNF